METAAATPAPDDGEGGDGADSKAKKSKKYFIHNLKLDPCFMFSH